MDGIETKNNFVICHNILVLKKEKVTMLNDQTELINRIRIE